MGKKQPNKSTEKKITATTSSSSPLGKVFLLFTLFGGLSSYYAYVWLTTPPELPEVNLDYWWGPYPMDPNPDLSIRPYIVEFSDVVVHDLKERLLHRRVFTPPLEHSGFTYGFNSDFLNRILDFWQNDYNFKDRELFLNKYQHFVTNIQGLDIHFLHAKPQVAPNVEVVPLVLLHGWPGSVREFYEMIPQLTQLRPGSNFVFEVFAPSLPGFGFSQTAIRPGMGPFEMAVVIRNLMARIGRSRYYVQGGDLGGVIGSIMATVFPEHVLGFHTNMPSMMFSPLASLYMAVGSLWPSLLDSPEVYDRMYPLMDNLQNKLEESGYMHIQATKPDTVGTALSDSPAGLAAYILEKFATWTNPTFKKSSDGNLLQRYQLTHLIDNVMIYWATNTITSSMRIYAEAFSKKQLAYHFDSIPTTVPTWGIKFKHEILYYPDCVLRLKYKNYVHSTVVDEGGHFAALENPDILADDIYDAVTAFRQLTTKQEKTVEASHEKAASVYDFTVKDIHGRDVKLDKYKGHVLIIVNVASECGLTQTNYEQLNLLHDKYAKSRGLRILAFPCNQFGGQEPGSPKDILKFTKQKGVQFDLFEKVEVNGDDAHPLWKFLKQSQTGTIGDFIKWNFSKFIIDRNGKPVERLGPTVNPIDLEPYLAKYW